MEGRHWAARNQGRRNTGYNRVEEGGKGSRTGRKTHNTWVAEAEGGPSQERKSHPWGRG